MSSANAETRQFHCLERLAPGCTEFQLTFIDYSYTTTYSILSGNGQGLVAIGTQSDGSDGVTFLNPGLSQNA